MNPKQTAAGRLADRRRLIWVALASQLFRPLRRIWQHWVQMRLERRTVEELSDLDDRELADIGLSRRDIRATVSGRLEQTVAQTREPLPDQLELELEHGTPSPQPCGSVS